MNFSLSETLGEKESSFYSAFVSFYQRLKNFAVNEIVKQKGQFFLWVPVFWAFGIGFYYLLPIEPALWSGVGILLLLASFYFLLPSDFILRPAFIFLLLMACGFFNAQIHTMMIDAPMLSKRLGPVDVTGNIQEIENLEEGAGVRLLLTNLTVERLQEGKTPHSVRLRLRKAYQDLKLGDRVRVLAQLHPPSQPLIFGGFDFRRYMYFQRIGAVGFIYNQPDIVEKGAALHPFSSFQSFWRSVRFAVERRIDQAVDYPQSSLAKAFLIGERASISEENNEAMRNSGLAHLLAISGLHIGMFAGVVFFTLRLLMASIPSLALNVPIKKVAAIFAFLAAAIYMMLAGATIPTQRALLMVGVVFFAILLDRSPISLRLVAFAALVVLIISPDSLLSASFHLSFAAVTCLIAFYDITRSFWQHVHSRAGFIKRAALYFIGVSATTLVASTVTMPFALYHFHQSPLYGLVGNFFAVPLMAFFVMPMAVLSLFLLPFGLESFALEWMGFGISLILEIAHSVSDLPYAVFRTPAWSWIAMVFFTLGFLFFLLWQGRLRWAGLIVVGCAVISMFFTSQPDLLISDRLNLVGVKREQGLYVSNLQKERFAREIWLESLGFDEAALAKWTDTDFIACDDTGCRFALKGKNISYLKTPFGADEECGWADLILSQEPLESFYCPNAYSLDFFDIWRAGPMAIYIDPDRSGRSGIEIKDNSNLGRRPWTLND